MGIMEDCVSSNVPDNKRVFVKEHCAVGVVQFSQAEKIIGKARDDMAHACRC